jgi:hypothetical protein
MSSALRQQASVNAAVPHRWQHQRPLAARAIVSGSGVQLTTSLYRTHCVTSQKIRMFASRLVVQLFTVTCQWNSVSSQNQFNSFNGSSYMLTDRRTDMADVKKFHILSTSKLRGSFLQLFIENGRSNSNPATGALYKIGQFRITEQVGRPLKRLFDKVEEGLPRPNSRRMMMTILLSVLSFCQQFLHFKL